MFNILLHKKGDLISESIIKNGYWGKYETEIITEIIRQDKNFIFVDIGANIGYFSLLVASHKIKTIAFEPITESYNLFLNSIKMNNYEKYIKVYKVGLGDIGGKKDFYVMKRNYGCATTLKPRYPYDYIESLEIDIGDKYLQDIDVDMFIKIDVENSEKYVIKGLEKTLSINKVKYLMIELSKFRDQIEIFDTIKKYFKYGIIVDKLHRFDKNMSILNKKTNYLDNNLIYNDINYLREVYREGNDNFQENILFIR